MGLGCWRSRSLQAHRLNALAVTAASHNPLAPKALNPRRAVWVWGIWIDVRPPRLMEF